MRKLIFIMMSMVVLIGLSSNIFAQGTQRAPEIGKSYEYTWNNVTATGITFLVNQDSTFYGGATLVSAGSGDCDGVYTVNGTSTPGPVDGDATINITWNPASDGNTYFLWIRAQSADGCYNYRNVRVVPEDVTDFDLIVLGMAAVDADTTALKTTYTSVNGTNDCADTTLMDNEIFNMIAGGDDGEVYVYFRADTVSSSGCAETWSFDFNYTNGLTDPQAQYLRDGSWVNVADGGTVSGIPLGYPQLIRVRIDTPTATGNVAGDGAVAVGATMENAEDSDGLSDNDSNNNSEEFTVNPIGAIGGFAGS